MNSLEIVKQAAHTQMGANADMDTFLKKLVGWTKKANNKLVQIGNTVFLVTLINPQTCQVSILNADSEPNLINNIKGIAKTLKSQGIKKMTGYANDKKYLDLAKKTQLPFKIKQGQGMAQDSAVPAYVFELDL